VSGTCDHLTPIVLIALNTGMRRGELFSMQWIDIDFKAKNLAVRGENSKTSKTRIIPLNNEAFSVLMKWEKQTTKKLFIFPGKNDKKLTDIKTAFKNLLKLAKIMTTAEAKQKELPIINGFWFHALRHTFASKLAMKGVDLNTIRELLGHSDIKMTMRYAHLSPNHKSEAVKLLNSCNKQNSV
jgi:integrase